MRVLVIGGGVGGLALAHGLRKAGIEVHVFEKQPRNTESLAGYGLHIDHNGRQALRSCLPLPNWTRIQSLFSSAGTQLFFRDSQLRVLATKDDAEFSFKTITEIERSGIGRLDLRDALIDGLDNENDSIIHWGMSFVRYENTPDGKVRAHFEDGTHHEADLIVGADGPNSTVRKQRLPDVNRIDLGVSAIAGRYILNNENIHRFPTDLTNGSLNNIVPLGRGWMFTAAWKSRPVDGNELSAPQRYIVWAYVAPSEDIPPEADRGDPSKLQDFVLKSMEGWSPELRELVVGCDASSTKCLSLRSMPILTPWESSSITLIGDAIHNMTPMGGKGANTALRDAETLTRWLVDAAARRLSVTESVNGYEEEMRRYANEALKLSTQNAVNACDGRIVMRAMFHGFLRVAQAVPFVKRATLGRTDSDR